MVSKPIFIALAIISRGVCNVVLESVAELPAGWVALPGKTLRSQTPMQMSIALRQPSIRVAQSKLLSGARLSHPEASSLTQPDDEDAYQVLQWLKDNGITNAQTDNSWIRVKTTMDKAESLLDMKMAQYQFENKKPVLRTQRYSVSETVAQSIDFIHPIANFMVPKNEMVKAPSAAQKRGQQESSPPPPCVRGTTPDCIRNKYQMPNVKDLTTQTSSIRFGIAGFLENNANYNDAKSFLAQAAAPIAGSGSNFSVELINGGQNDQDPQQSGFEAALDIEYALALGFPTQITFYSTGGRGVRLNDSGEPSVGADDNNEPYLDLLQYLLDKQDSELPQVLSVSYADDELSVPQPYAERVCNMFGVLTARGTSILVGSGDGGSAGSRNSSCRAMDGSNDEVTMATFPGTCPWVTAVGANTAADPPEGAGFSGGGFSQYFPRQDWQASAVDGYVSALNGHLQGHYNPSMRAVPDVSAIGTQFFVIVGGQPTQLQGTSASTPVFGSMIALINDVRVKQGKSVLGFLNRYLYMDEVKGALQDVSKGESQSCTWDGSQPGGWPAVAGWDAITGLGQPERYDDLMRVLMDV